MRHGVKALTYPAWARCRYGNHSWSRHQASTQHIGCLVVDGGRSKTNQCDNPKTHDALAFYFFFGVCVCADRNVPNTSTTGSAALEKRKSDLLDFYLKVDELTPGSESATILLTPIHHFHLYL